MKFSIKEKLSIGNHWGIWGFAPRIKAFREAVRAAEAGTVDQALQAVLSSKFDEVLPGFPGADLGDRSWESQ